MRRLLECGGVVSGVVLKDAAGQPVNNPVRDVWINGVIVFALGALRPATTAAKKSAPGTVPVTA